MRQLIADFESSEGAWLFVCHVRKWLITGYIRALPFHSHCQLLVIFHSIIHPMEMLINTGDTHRVPKQERQPIGQPRRHFSFFLSYRSSFLHFACTEPRPGRFIGIKRQLFRPQNEMIKEWILQHTSCPSQDNKCPAKNDHNNNIIDLIASHLYQIVNTLMRRRFVSQPGYSSPLWVGCQMWTVQMETCCWLGST